MTTKTVFTNRNEMEELVKSTCRVSICVPLARLDEIEFGGLLLLDMLFYDSPYYPWTERELFPKRPE